MAVDPSIRAHPEWPRLARLVHDLAFLDGGDDSAFTLASGRQSRWFFDTKPVMMHPQASRIMGELLNLRINSLGANLVGGLELGAVPLTAIVVTTGPDALRGFMVRKEPKDHGTGQQVEGPVEPGQKVIIVEDVITSGGSALKAVEVAREFGLEVDHVIAIIDRLAGGEAAFAAKGVKLTTLTTIRDFGIEPE